MNDFPTVTQFRRDTKHAVACPKPFEHWLVVARFRPESLRGRINMAVLRDFIEHRNPRIPQPVQYMDCFGDSREFTLVAVDPDVETEEVEQWTDQIRSGEALDDEGMWDGLMPEIARRWKALSTPERLFLFNRCGQDDAADGLLDDDPPEWAWSWIADGID